MHCIVLQVKKLKQLMTLGGSEQPATGETKSSARDVPELTEEEAALLNISDSEGEDSEGVNDREEECEQDTSSAEGSVQRELDRHLALTVKGARKAVRMRSRSVRNTINLDFDALQWWRDWDRRPFLSSPSRHGGFCACRPRLHPWKEFFPSPEPSTVRAGRSSL